MITNIVTKKNITATLLFAFISIVASNIYGSEYDLCMERCNAELIDETQRQICQNKCSTDSGRLTRFQSEVLVSQMNR